MYIMNLINNKATNVQAIDEVFPRLSAAFAVESVSTSLLEGLGNPGRPGLPSANNPHGRVFW